MSKIELESSPSLRGLMSFTETKIGVRAGVSVNPKPRPNADPDPDPDPTPTPTPRFSGTR